MKLKHCFVVDAPVAQVWALLTDLPAFSSCLPGATLHEEIDGVYHGAVHIRVGPVMAEYRGSAEFTERDDIRLRTVIDSCGVDTRGSGDARARITAELTDLGGRTQVDVRTHMQVSGKTTQLGKGVLQDVSEKLMAQFARCVNVKLEGESALDAVAVASASEAPKVTTVHCEEDFDLLTVAGGPVIKRAAPIAAAALVLLALLIVLV